MPTERPHCFHRGGFQPDDNAAIVEFSDASVYRYEDLDESLWLTWSGDEARGSYFNLHIRPGPFHFQRLDTWPSGLIHEFVDPLGVGG